MEAMDNYLLLLQSVVAIFALFILYKVWSNSSNRHKQPPQPSGALPVIGHLHLFRDGQPLYRKLADMADKLGPTFMVRLGSRRTLIISSWDVVKESFTINDKVFSSRPLTAAGKYMCYDGAMLALAPYGDYWRVMRKIATSELLSNTSLDKLKHVILGEIDTCIKDLHGLCGSINNNNHNRVDMKEFFGDMAFNIVFQMVAGKRFSESVGSSDEAWRFRKAVKQFIHLLFASVPSDIFPWLEWMDLGGHVKAMKTAAKDMDSMMAKLVADGDTDFMDQMISIVEDDHELQGYFDKETVIKATSLNLILGGSDTTAISLTRVLAHLLNNPDVMKKVRTELDEQVGVNRVVNESDIKNLIYLQAVIKESFRLTPPAELLFPRETVGDCTVAGFQIPAGTQMILNVWKVQRDPGVWPDPLEFLPERFLPNHAAAGIDVKGHNHELIPFGTGRRSCPGIAMALHVMHLTLAKLIQAFEFTPMNNGPAERSESLSSLTLYSAPMEVEITPRLSPEL